MDIMAATKAQAQQAVSEGVAFGLNDSYTVVTHSRGTTWVVENSAGQKVLVTLTEGGKNVVAVSDYNHKKTAKAETFQGGVLRIGRNLLNARKSNKDGRVERMDRDGNWTVFTGTAKFQAR